jgi:hypothetical protein
MILSSRRVQGESEPLFMEHARLVLAVRRQVGTCDWYCVLLLCCMIGRSDARMRRAEPQAWWVVRSPSIHFFNVSIYIPGFSTLTSVLITLTRLPLAFNGRHFQVEQFSIGHFSARHGSRRQGLLGRCEASTAPLANPDPARGLSAVSRFFPPNARCERGAGG